MISSVLADRSRASSELNYFLSTYVQPNEWSVHTRRRVYSFIESCIRESARHLGILNRIEVLLFGSFYLSTYLPDGDIDITVKCSPEDVTSLTNRLHSDLQRHNVYVTFVQAEVKLLKCLVEGICIDVSFNQVGGVAAGRFVHEADGRFGSHLVKKSLLLIKAWAYYESHVLGGNGGMLGTYAITVMLLGALNSLVGSGQLDVSTATPLDILWHFLHYYSKVDITAHLLTLYGSTPLPIERSAVDDSRCVIDKAFLQHFMSRNADLLVAAQGTSAPPSPRSTGGTPTTDSKSATSAETLTASVDFSFDPRDRPVNIADPLRPGNNLGRGVHRCHALRIHSAIQKGAKDLDAVLQSYASTDPNAAPCILAFFEKTVRACVVSPMPPPPPPPPPPPLNATGATQRPSSAGTISGFPRLPPAPTYGYPTALGPYMYALTQYRFMPPAGPPKATKETNTEPMDGSHPMARDRREHRKGYPHPRTPTHHVYPQRTAQPPPRAVTPPPVPTPPPVQTEFVVIPPAVKERPPKTSPSTTAPATPETESIAIAGMASGGATSQAKAPYVPPYLRKKDPSSQIDGATN
jgi:predicted nucleotidyltransferase